MAFDQRFTKTAPPGDVAPHFDYGTDPLLDKAHAQAIVAVRRTGIVGASGPSYWLVRFRAEGDR